MADNIKMEDISEEVAPTSEATEEQTEETTETEPVEQDPLKIELERVKQKEGRTELEKAQYSLKKNAERLKELGGDPSEVIGFEKHDDFSSSDDDDAPVTLGMLRKMQQESAAKTALQLANEIPDEVERELTKYHLANSIKSTGNPTEDINLARAIVNAAKNKQIIEEIARKSPAKTHSSASSAPAKIKEKEEPLTKDEMAFMKPPFNMSKEEILKARR